MRKVLFSLLVTFTLACAAMLCQSSEAGGKKAPAPAPSPSPVAVVSPQPPPVPGAILVTLGELGPSVNRAFAERALSLMNQAYSSGCLRREVEGHKYLSLNSVFTPGETTSESAFARFVKGAPYRLDLRWYYKGWPSSTVGYTYNFKDDDWNGESETRIWSNTRFMSDERGYASHLAHELSHQARAGGFVHYTIHAGSFPYDTGDLMAKCVRGLP